MEVPINLLVRKMLNDPKTRNEMLKFIFGDDIILPEEKETINKSKD